MSRERTLSTRAVLDGDRLALARLLTEVENDTPAGQDALDEPDGPEEIELEDLPELFRRSFGRGPDARSSRVIDEDVDGPGRLEARIDR